MQNITHIENHVDTSETRYRLLFENMSEGFALAEMIWDEQGNPVDCTQCAEFIIDITERKQAEEELRHRTEELIAANQELEAFSYSVSHDLRSPLTTIQGFSSILLEDYGEKLDESGKAFIDHIRNASDKMGSIINDLLKIARISRERIKCKTTDLSPIANSIIKELRDREPEREVSVSIDENMPAIADPGFMTITLTNLIENAWKYTGRNPDARIEIGVTDRENEKVYFVRDNGVGFDMKYANKIFKPFERLHSDSQFAGTGIGLAIVHKIIQRHGGRIWAESEPGKGAAFYFTLECRV